MVFSKWRGILIRVHYLMVFGGESDKSTIMMVRMTTDKQLTEPLTAKHISLFFLVSLGVELRRELRQQ
jgi:hypothetical protein